MIFVFEESYPIKKIDTMIKVFSLAILLIFPLYFNLGCTTADLDIAEAPLETFLGHWDIEGGGVLFFDEENFSVSAGCNTLFGTYTSEENTLTFSMLASTLIGCPDAEGNREQELAAVFNNAVLRFEVEENQARLVNSAGEVMLNLFRPENAALTNKWQLTSLRTANAVSSSILDEGTGITFATDGTVELRTACNSGGGTYTINENSLGFEALFFTEMGCDTERTRREQEFKEALSYINSYTILREVLTLEQDGTVFLTLKLSR